MERQTIYLGKQRALTTTQRGHLMYVQTTDLSLAPWIMLNGVWEEACTEIFCDVVRPGMTVVEVGANIGYFTLLAADCVGPNGCVHAFEPDPQNFELLRDNVEVNGFTGRVTLHREALSDHAGRATFYSTTKHRGNGSLIERLDQLGDNSGEVVPFDVDVATLDAFALGPIDVLKIDAEGSEPFVFRGGRETIERSPNVTAIVEYWPKFFAKAGEDAAEFLREREREGFSLARIAGRKDPEILPSDVATLQQIAMTELVLRKTAA